MNPNLEEAIINFDIISFLEEHGIDYALEGENIGKDYIGISICISCGKELHHAGIHKENKTYTCWACKDNMWLGRFISKVKEIPISKAIDLIIEDLPEREKDIVNQIKTIFENNREPKFTLILRKKPKELPPSVPISSNLIKAHKPLQEFLKERNLTKPDLDEYNIRIGINGKYKSRLILPIYYERKLVAFQTRHLTQKIYLNEGSTGHYLYRTNKINTKYPLIIVEGIFDYINTYKFVNKYYKGKLNVTTGFTKKLTPEQIKLLNKINIDTVIFILDNDSWHDYYSSGINLNNSRVDFIILPKGKDPGSLSQKEFLRIFNDNKEVLSQSNSTRSSTSFL
jgi:hypothetical protein